MTTPDLRPVTNSLLEMLQGAATFPIGDHEAPERDPELPWGILYTIPGGEFHGSPLYAPDSDASMVVQVDVVGTRRDQAQFGGDQIRRTMLARTGGVFQVAFPDMEFLKVIDRQPVGGPSGIIPSGDPGHRVYSWSERFALYVTPV